MKFLQRVTHPLNALWRGGITPPSLQFRLTVGLAAVSLLGIVGMGTWTTLEMRQMLLVQHKQSLWAIADRLSNDLATTPGAELQPALVQRAIARESSPAVWLWVRGMNGQVLGRSLSLSLQQQGTVMALAQMPTKPAVSQLDGRYLVLCRRPLVIQGRTLGQLYMAQDITHDYTVLTTLVRSMILATVLAIALIIALVSLFTWRSLSPLRQMNQLAKQPTQRLNMQQIPREVKDLVMAFDQLSLRLSAAGEQQQQLTNDISHELRTSLSLIYGYLQSTLRRSDNLTASQKDALEVAASETEHTIRLLKDLLDLARIKNGDMAFCLQPVQLNQLAEAMVEVVPQSEVLAIRVKATEAVVAIADECQIVRVLTHLIENAVRYSSGAPVELMLSQTEDWAMIAVSDCGCGIPPTEQARIFDPFYRVDASRCKTTGGVGLGLSIVKALVEGMGGHITVQSTPGKGSTFTVMLPSGKRL